MLKINREAANLERLTTQTLTQARILERQDLQRMIVAKPDPFFEEMGERLVLIGQEVRPSELVADRIDLLAIDADGNTVVIELKRAEDRLQLLQALSYAAMIADWTADDLVNARSTFGNEPHQAALDTLRDHQNAPDTNELNKAQRVILIAEAFDYALLKCAEWLAEAHEVDIRCFKIEHVSDGAAEYLSCVCIYPPAELVDNASRARKERIAPENQKIGSWAELLGTVTNEAVRRFFSRDDTGGEKRLRSRDIAFRIRGDRRLGVGVRRKHAYVWQNGRFDGDVEFWRAGLSVPTKVLPVDSGRSLSFQLVTAADFAFFEDALRGRLTSVDFKDYEEIQEEYQTSQRDGEYLENTTSADVGEK